MKKWRPEGWENPYPIPPLHVFNRTISSDDVRTLYNLEQPTVRRHEDYEAGADAMLEALDGGK